MTREPYRPTVPDFGAQPEENELDRNGHPNLARTYIAPNPMQEPEPQPHYAEIADATSEHADAPPPPYTAQTITNRHGKNVLRLRFENFEALERFFVEELIGSDMMKGSASKVIGTTLLIWDRN
jgi:hypothetical protein